MILSLDPIDQSCRHEVIVHYVQFDVEHDERYDPLVQI